MKRYEGLFVFSRGQQRLLTSISTLLIIGMLLPSGLAFAEDDLYRQSKEDFTPHPYLPPNFSGGAYERAVPIALPSGRSGMQPDLKLSYSSSLTKQDSPFGYGWSLNIPYIERLNKIGVDSLYNQDLQHSFFYSSLSGELLPIGTTTAVNGSFLGFSLSTLLKPYVHLALNEQPIGYQVDDSSISGTPTDTSSATSTTLDNSLPETSTAFAIAHDTNNTPQEPKKKTHASIPELDWTTPNGAANYAIDTPVELVDRRTEYTQEFVEMGSDHEPRLHYRSYAEPQFFENSNTGAFDYVDTRIESTSTGFVMAKAPYRLSLDTTGADHLMSLTYRGENFYVDASVMDKGKDSGALARQHAKHPDAVGSAAASTDQSITYPDYFGEGVDLSITALPSRVVEEVVFRDNSVLASTVGDYVEVPFALSGDGQLALRSDGKTLAQGATLVSSSSVLVSGDLGTARILPPVAIAAGSDATDTPVVVPIDIAYTVSSSSITFTKRIPVAFLRHATYPVRSDATFDFSPTTGQGSLLTHYAYNTWAGAHDATDATNLYSFFCAETYRYPDGYGHIYRAFMPFDTSALDDATPILSATMYVHPGNKEIDLPNDTHTYLGLVGPSTQASATSLVVQDFDQLGATLWSDTKVASTSAWVSTSSAFVAFPLNATGIANVSKTGYTELGFREGHDIDNVDPGTSKDDFWIWDDASAGTSTAPYLEVILSPDIPLAPDGLEVNDFPNPVGVATSSPSFSGVFEIASSTALAIAYQIQITTSPTTWNSPYFDSGKLTLSSSTPAGVRTPEIYSTTTFASDGTKYYWRMRLWTQTGQVGAWSSSGEYFVMDYAHDYGAKVENGDFMTYHYAPGGGGWTAKDKRGWQYVFGNSTSSRIDNNNPATSTFRWMLESVTDTNGNAIHYTYAKDASTSQVYPSKITYTDSAGATGIGEVSFLREARSDVSTSSIAGFPVATKDRIKEILVRTNGVLTHRYQLGYSVGNNVSVGSSRVDLQACKLEYSIVSPK